MNKKMFALAGVVTSIALLMLVPVIAGAQPKAAPPFGNVNAKFNSVTINDGTSDNLTLASDGRISNPSGPVRVDDSNGLIVNGTNGVAPVLTVTGNGKNNAIMHSDGWITGTGGFHLGGDGTYANAKFVIYSDGKITANNGPVTIWDGDGLDVRGNITNKGGQLTLKDDADGIKLDSNTSVSGDISATNNANIYYNVNASGGNFTYHLKARRIGSYKWSHQLYVTMPPNATTDFTADPNSGILTCDKDSVAVACNFSAYNGTAGCGSGSPSGGLNKDGVYPTYQYMDPLLGTNTGGICSMSLYNKTSGWLCGRVEVICWDTDGDL